MKERKGPPGYPGDDVVRKQFGDALRKLRLEKGLTLEQVDAALNEPPLNPPHPQWPRALGIVTRRLRKSKNMSRGQLSDTSGLPLRFINTIERGKGTDISVTQIVRLAMALEQSADEFVAAILDCESNLKKE